MKATDKQSQAQQAPGTREVRYSQKRLLDTCLRSGDVEGALRKLAEWGFDMATIEFKLKAQMPKRDGLTDTCHNEITLNVACEYLDHGAPDGHLVVAVRSLYT
jgi:hypothetical protein